MKKKEIIMLIIILFLVIGLVIMTQLYLNMRKSSKLGLESTLSAQNEMFELNKKVSELESEIETLKNEKVIVDTYTFYAEIKEIIEKDEMVTLLVDGLDVNNINNRGEFYITIDKETKLVWQGVNLNMNELKVGQNIAITYDGGVLETAPAKISKLYRVELLDSMK